MSDTDWRKFLDELLGGKGLRFDPGILKILNPLQKFCYDEVRKGRARIKRKNNT
jgi:hypothetical protein